MPPVSKFLGGSTANISYVETNLKVYGGSIFNNEANERKDTPWSWMNRRVIPRPGHVHASRVY